MDLQYLNNKSRYIELLTKWAFDIIQNKGWEQWDDLHVDEIDSIFRNRKYWFDSGIFLQSCLSEIINKSEYSSLLIMPLSYSNRPTMLDDLDVNKLKSELDDMTPPSIIFFPKNDLDYQMTYKQSQYLSRLSFQIGKDVYFKEEQENDNEFFRVIFILQ
jgi:hypothetical protein